MNERELIRTVTGFRSGILGGRKPNRMCFAVCAPLHSYLSGLGFKTSLIEGIVEHGDQETDHYWIELPDGRIIDPTASQFNDPSTGNQMPDVYIGPVPAWYDSNPWRPMF